MSTASLLAALNSDDAWYDEGHCVGEGAGLFFARRGELSRSLREDLAKSLCMSCPVLAQCAEWALNVGELSGVWAGGLSTAERAESQRAAFNAS